MNTAELQKIAMQARDNGRITQKEYEFYIASLAQKEQAIPAPTAMPIASPDIGQISECNPTVAAKKPSFIKRIKSIASRKIDAATTNPILDKRTTVIAAFFIICILGIASSIFYSDGIAGYVTFDTANKHFTNETIPATVPLTSIKASGMLLGEGNATIMYVTNNTSYIVAQISSDTNTPRTHKPSYAAGEEVAIEHLPSEYSAYLQDESSNTPIGLPFSAPEQNMTLLLIANDSGQLTTYYIPIIIGNIPRTTTFDNVCEQSCSFEESLGDLVITTTEGSTIQFTNIETVVAQNHPPQLMIAIADVYANDTAAPKVIDLSMHFADADSDTLYYSTSRSAIANVSIDGNKLTITPLSNGTEQLTIYASDLQELISASIQLTAEVTVISDENIINSTTNDTVINNSLNVTSANTTTNSANNTVANNTTTEPQANSTTCTDPDPNKRPLECIVDTNYFNPESIYIDNKNAEHVGVFTPIGNLLIRGDVVQHTTGSPDIQDYQLGYKDSNDNFVPTIWIDTTTGDLHLKGSLIEANGQLPYREGYTAYTNKRNIIVGLANLREGELILRGSIIPYRRSIE